MRSRPGRGSPHGGVFLDIAWIKEKLPGAADHIKRKLPSMYHQFKELADLDITQEPMEVGPTTHYIMGGIRVDADTQVSTIPGLFAAGECAAGINGANRLGGNSLSDLIVFGKRAGEYAAAHAADARPRQARRGGHRDRPRRPRWRRSTAARAGENPYAVQQDLQDTMQDLVGIVRVEARDARRRCTASRGAERARERAPASRDIASTTRAGTRASTCGTCWPSPRPSRGRRSSAARAGAVTSATTTRTRTPSSPPSTSSCIATPTARCASHGGPFRQMPAELAQIIEDQKQ